ncbi:uncharacterized protein [Arachis hypogaea]|uniref:uncharacterized protein isoform X1 n=1 Tax=Arachis hypogaea TaxID=3818 RepID=UPI000DEC3F7F|nr:uncharacterized protein LOC112727600 isoform X1 [Arachis hypogaea]
MGSTNFGIVRKQLRDSKENSEEPSRAEVFIATRTSKKGKEIDAKTQATITELQNRLEAGENEEDAFVGVLGKDQPGRLRCYGASITRSSLKKDEEIRHIKVEYNTKVSSLEKKMDGVCGLLKILVHQLNPGMSNEEVTALVQAAQDSPVDTSSSKAKNTPRSSEATHIPHKDDDSRAYEYTSMKNLNESENGFWGALARKAKSICSCSFVFFILQGIGQNNLPCNDDA